MLISQEGCSESHERQGCRRASLAELRRRLAKPSSLDDGHRQRLVDFVQRLARVRSLGDEYGRVELSGYAAAALRTTIATV